MEQKKKALGRGLEQLFDTEILDFDSFESNVLENTKAEDIQEINLNEIRSNPYQPRKVFNDESLKELAESIKNYGVFQPIIVKKSIRGYDLVAGERRVKASLLAGKTTIPAIIKDFSDDTMREIALLENLQREDLTAIELALAYKNIIDSLGITQEELADKVGKSRSSVTNTLGLLRLPQVVQQMVLDGKISMGHARELSKIDDLNKIVDIANRIVKDDLSVRETENLIKGPSVKKANPVSRAKINTQYEYVERKLKETFGTKVKMGNKKIEIRFSNASDLDRILDIMNIKFD